MKVKKIVFGVVGTIVGLLAILFLAQLWFLREQDVKIDGAAQLIKSERPKVVALFSYGCPHCYSLESALNRWLDENGNQIDFVRVPAVVDQTWLPMFAKMKVWAHTYYALEEMGIVVKMHERLFEAMHIEKLELSTEQDIVGFLSNEGVDVKAFERSFRSQNVLQKVSEAEKYTAEYELRETPMVVVNDYFRATIRTAGYDNAQLIRNMEDFVRQSRKEE
jgi:thiol:disulfide interchange protein DsbA